MNWQKASIDDLRSHYARLDALGNLSSRIEVNNARKESLKSPVTDTAPVMGGASRIEDALLNNLVEGERLQATYDATKKLVDITERGLKHLTETEREVLERFYMRRSSNHIEELKERLNMEKSQIYRIKDEALYKFTVAMYGLVDY